SLDQPHSAYPIHNNTSPGVLFNLETFHLHEDPILTSAGPFQQGYTFSPTHSPLVTTGSFHSSSYSQTPTGTTLNSTELYSPPASGYQSNPSTPQPGFENDHSLYFDQPSIDPRSRRAMGVFASHRSSNLSAS